MGRVAIAAEQLVQLLMADPGEDGGVGDLVTIEVQDWQNRTIGNRVEELVGVPAGRQRSGLGLAVADNTGHDQVGVVESGAVGVRDGVAEFAPLMDRARRLRRHMARNAARERELGEEAVHALLIARDERVDLAVGAFEIGIGDQRRAAMSGSGDVDHVEVEFFDQPVQVDIDEVQTRRRSPVAEKPRLDVLLGESLFQQRVVVEIDLPHRQVIGRPPIRIHQSQFLVRKRVRHHCLLWSRVAMLSRSWFMATLPI